MYLVTQTHRCKVNRVDLGIEIADGRVLVPQELGAVLTTVGAWTCDAIATALLKFPTAFKLGLHLSELDFAEARDGALKKLETIAGVAELGEKPTHPLFGQI
jgi:hypothetical protein